MRILVITPAPPRSRKGNRIGALRRARLLRQLGHRVAIASSLDGRRPDLLLALHAVKSASEVVRFRDRFPRRPIFLVLTGTDVYRSLWTDKPAQQAMDAADRIIALQKPSRRRLPPRWRGKCVVIRQSVAPAARSWSPPRGRFEICVPGHLRPVKDPFRAALAVRGLTLDRPVRVTQIGAALTPAMARQAAREAERNPRYRYLGELPRWRTLERMARSSVMVLSSRIEGSPNVLCEAVMLGVPIIASRIDATVDLLGSDHPGLFAPGSTKALRGLLERAASNERFLEGLAARSRAVRPHIAPERERRALSRLLIGLE